MPGFRLPYIRPILSFNLGAVAGLVTANAGGWRVVQVGDRYDLRLFGRTVGTLTARPDLGNGWGAMAFLAVGGLLAVGAYWLACRLLVRRKRISDSKEDLAK